MACKYLTKDPKKSINVVKSHTVKELGVKFVFFIILLFFIVFYYLLLSFIIYNNIKKYGHEDVACKYLTKDPKKSINVIKSHTVEELGVKFVFFYYFIIIYHFILLFYDIIYNNIKVWT